VLNEAKHKNGMFNKYLHGNLI